MKKAISVDQAANEMGISPQAVRERMKRGLVDLGDVVPIMERKGRKKSQSSQKYRYYIYRNKLDKWLIERGLKDSSE
ncbi:MAG: hypothetical protein K2M46_10620 [Lachnospiraceae bacterium]|nr:hypothetical protein [Lachnospiraceae bacterium]